MADKPTVTFTPPRDTSTPAQIQAGALAADAAKFARRLEVDDAGRARFPMIEMVALVGFTIESGNAVEPERRTIQAGETFELNEYDVAKFAGRARRKLLDPSTL